MSTTTRSNFIPPAGTRAAHRLEARHRAASIRAYRRRTRLYPALQRLLIVAVIVAGVSAAAMLAPGRIGLSVPATPSPSVGPATAVVLDMDGHPVELELPTR